MVNDMAFQFREEFPKVLASKYTIRDPAFIGRTITIEKARPRSRMEDIAAVIGTWQGKTGKNFSGFEEEITGSLSDDSYPHRRVILPAGRKGKTMKGRVQSWAKWDEDIPSIDDPALANVPEESRLAAMVRMMAQGKIAHTPANTFILKGPRYKHPGIFRFKGGKLPVGKAFKRGKGRVDMLQVFVDKPVMPPKWDWRGETADKIKSKFTPDYIFENYILAAMTAAMGKTAPVSNIDTRTGNATIV